MSQDFRPRTPSEGGRPVVPAAPPRPSGSTPQPQSQPQPQQSPEAPLNAASGVRDDPTSGPRGRPRARGAGAGALPDNTTHPVADLRGGQTVDLETHCQQLEAHLRGEAPLPTASIRSPRSPRGIGEVTVGASSSTTLRYAPRWDAAGLGDDPRSPPSHRGPQRSPDWTRGAPDCAHFEAEDLRSARLRYHLVRDGHGQPTTDLYRGDLGGHHGAYSRARTPPASVLVRPSSGHYGGDPYSFQRGFSSPVQREVSPPWWSSQTPTPRASAGAIDLESMLRSPSPAHARSTPERSPSPSGAGSGRTPNPKPTSKKSTVDCRQLAVRSRESSPRALARPQASMSPFPREYESLAILNTQVEIKSQLQKLDVAREHLQHLDNTYSKQAKKAAAGDEFLWSENCELARQRFDQIQQDLADQKLVHQQLLEQAEREWQERSRQAKALAKHREELRRLALEERRKQEHLAASKIQSAVRRWRWRRTYEQLRLRRWRKIDEEEARKKAEALRQEKEALLAKVRRMEQQEVTRLRKKQEQLRGRAAVTIQSCWRGRVARKKFFIAKTLASEKRRKELEAQIQERRRGEREQVEAKLAEWEREAQKKKKRLEAVLRLQRQFRARKARRKLLELKLEKERKEEFAKREAAARENAVAQAALARYEAQEQERRRKRAILRLQSAVRARKAKLVYVALQAQRRATLSAEREEAERKREEFRKRIEAQERKAAETQAAVKIQRAFRGRMDKLSFVAMIALRRKQLKEKEEKEKMREKQALNEAAKAAWDKFEAKERERQREEAVIRIQKAYRARMNRFDFVVMIAFRRKQLKEAEEKAAEERRLAAEAALLRLEEKEHAIKREQAALKIQRMIRGRKMRFAIVVQMAALKQKAEQNKREAALKRHEAAEAAWKAYQLKEERAKREQAAIKIQSVFRSRKQRMAYIALKAQRMKALEKKEKEARALREKQLEKARKRWEAQELKKKQTAAAIQIQRIFRGHRQRVAFLAMKAKRKAKAAEAEARKISLSEKKAMEAKLKKMKEDERRRNAAQLARKRAEEYEIKATKAATRLQAVARRWAARRKLKRLKEKKRLEEKEHAERVEKLRQYQASAKQRNMEDQLRKLRRQAAVRLQAAWRVYCARRLKLQLKEEQLFKEAVAKQRAADRRRQREIAERRIQELELREKQKQDLIREKAATVRKLRKIEEKKQSEAAKKIQKFWRGRRERKWIRTMLEKRKVARKRELEQQQLSRREAAARKIQTKLRSKLQRRRYLLARERDRLRAAHLPGFVEELREEVREQHQLLSWRKAEAARLRLLLSLGSEFHRCHQCDLGLTNLQSLLQASTRIVRLLLYCPSMPGALPLLKSELLAEIRESLALVAHLDPQVAELANLIPRTRKKAAPVSPEALESSRPPPDSQGVPARGRGPQAAQQSTQKERGPSRTSRGAESARSRR